MHFSRSKNALLLNCLFGEFFERGNERARSRMATSQTQINCCVCYWSWTASIWRVINLFVASRAAIGIVNIAIDLLPLEWPSLERLFQTDLDFKGYYSLVCQDKCVVDFHVLCWRNLKEEEDVSNDKEFLGKACLTPGQFWNLMRINYRIGRFFCDSGSFS